jgi:hypothetical protein
MTTLDRNSQYPGITDVLGEFQTRMDEILGKKDSMGAEFESHYKSRLSAAIEKCERPFRSFTCISSQVCTAVIEGWRTNLPQEDFPKFCRSLLV